jgi:8-oxo-dGTP diphosphatase
MEAYDGPFKGAKLMLFAGEDLVVIRRDDIPTIPWPGHLDFPGGEREGEETPEACVLRETFEELGLEISPDMLRLVLVKQRSKGADFHFAAHCGPEIVDTIVFGEEGQGWLTMRPEAYVAADDGIPQFQEILAAYLADKKKPGAS